MDLLSYLKREIAPDNELDVAIYNYVKAKYPEIKKKCLEKNIVEAELVGNDEGGVSLFLYTRDDSFYSICAYYDEQGKIYIVDHFL